MSDWPIRLYVWQQTARWQVASRALPSDAGEGVVSLAIGVLIMAFLGALLWVAFKATLGHATQNVDQQVSRLGQ
ncbi:MAG TPA: hypothetical protein VFA11_01470 [Acidimicrobiales bacterium]|nr:hypothetical protein [Acidimicrobiales bacterium]